MKTTLNIDDSVMERLRREAQRRGTTMSALVEAGLRRILDEQYKDKSTLEREPRKMPTWKSGGTMVDVSDRESLYQAMDSKD